MQECAVTVNRLRISGQRLLNLTDSDMSKFSLIHQPQLQKLVQDIKKNDGSLLNKLRRLRTKPVPKVPARDYRDRECDEQLSDDDYDNDMYEDLHQDQDDSYEPPPSQSAFSPTPPVAFPRGEYIDSCRNRPKLPPKKPLRPGKESKQLPPEPTDVWNNNEDYICPDGSNDDDNYVEPAEGPPADPATCIASGMGRSHFMPHSPLPQLPPSPDFYEVPDKEENSLPLPANRHCPSPSPYPLPPKPSPRLNMRRSPNTVQQPTSDDEYEVCDHDKAVKPLPRERSPKPPLRPRADHKPRELESRTLPLIPTEQPSTKPSVLSLDFRRPKIPLPQFTFNRQPDRESAENGTTDQDKDADIYMKPWFASTCDRKTADEVLFRSNKDGAFMVRKSSGQDAQQPYTLVVFYKGRVYNIPIRFIESTQQYALGKEKRGEEYFSSVSHIIENHQRNPLVLIDIQSNSKDAARLCYPVKP